MKAQRRRSLHPRKRRLKAQRRRKIHSRKTRLKDQRMRDLYPVERRLRAQRERSARRIRSWSARRTRRSTESTWAAGFKHLQWKSFPIKVSRCFSITHTSVYSVHKFPTIIFPLFLILSRLFCIPSGMVCANKQYGNQ